VNPGDAPILIFALTSDTMSQGQVYDAASTILQQQLARVEGVGQVVVGGSSLPAVRVDVNPQASRATRGLEDVRAAITATTLRRPKGSLTDGDRIRQLETNDQLTRAEQFRPSSSPAPRMPSFASPTSRPSRTTSKTSGRSASRTQAGRRC
jgi:multidrug efflux pump